MHILITDSGVGGLSVCAYAERFVRTHGFKESVRLTFAHAAPTQSPKIVKARGRGQRSSVGSGQRSRRCNAKIVPLSPASPARTTVTAKISSLRRLPTPESARE